MPFEAHTWDNPGLRAPGLIQPPDAPDTDGSLLAAAARQENIMVSGYNYLQDRSGWTYDPDHNPLDLIKDTDYERNHLMRFVSSRSAGESLAIMRRIDQEDHDRRLLSAGGFMGTLAQMIMGGLDPTLAIPGTILFKGISRGQAVLRSAGAGAGLIGTAGAIQAGVLHATQETRTPGEAVSHIAMSAVVGGLLGGAIGYLTSKQLANLTRAMEDVRREINAPDVPPGGGTASVGAEAVGKEGLTLESALGVEKIVKGFSPVTRLQTSPFETLRYFIRHTADAGLSYAENKLGVVTSEGGTVETRVKLWRGPEFEFYSTLDDAYARYVFDKTDPGTWDRLRVRAGWATVQAKRGGKMEQSEFREEITKTARRMIAGEEGEHPIPFVNEAAKKFRDLDEKLKRAAIDAEIPGFSEEMKTLGAKAHVFRMYNRDKIIAHRNGPGPESGVKSWTDTLLDHFREKHTAAVDAFDGAKAKRVGILEKELTDLEMPAAARPDAIATLEADAAKLKADNPDFVARDGRLTELRKRLAAARKEDTAATAGPSIAEQIDHHESMLAHAIGRNDEAMVNHHRQMLDGLTTRTGGGAKVGDETVDAAAVIRAEMKAEQEAGGDAYARYVSARVDAARRIDRLKRTTPTEAVMTEAQLATKLEGIEAQRLETLGRPARKGKDGAPDAQEVVGIFDTTRTQQLATLREPVERKLVALAAKRDQDLADIQASLDDMIRGSEVEIMVDGKPQIVRAGAELDRTEIRLRRAEADAASRKVSADHDKAVRKVESDFRPARERFERETRDQRAALIKKYRTDAATAKADFKASTAATARSASRAAQLRDQIANVRAEPAPKNTLASLQDAELEGMVNETTDKILGESIRRIPGLSIARGPQGALKERILDIPDHILAPYLENDIEKIARATVRTMAGDIEVAKKFGDVNASQVFAEALEEHAAKQKGVTGKQAAALDARFKADMKDTQLLLDRARGFDLMPDNPDGWLYRSARVALNISVMSKLGGMTVSSIADLARPIMRYGLDSAFRDGWVPFIRDLNTFKMAAHEVRMTGTGLDMVRNQTLLALADVMEDFGRFSKFERGVQWATDRFSMVALMAPWNGFGKQMAGVITMGNMIRSMKAIAEGKGTPKQLAKHISRLAEDGINEAMARRIWAHTSKHGDVVGDLHLPNTKDWMLPDGKYDAQAVDAFRAVINREVETLIVTPGLERPRWMSYTMGKVMGQFKSFSLVSTQRTTLAGLQQRDAAVLQGVLVALALGAVSAKLKSMVRGADGEDTSKWTPGKWAVEAMDNSGLLGVFMEVNNMSEKVTGGSVGLSRLSGKQVSRYASRNKMGALAGPTFDAISDATTLFRLTGPGESYLRGVDTPANQRWSAADTHAMRKVIPFQNLFYVRWIFEKAEKGINNSMSIPPRRPRQH